MATTRVDHRAAEILERKWASPFRPFVIETVDGQVYRVNDFMNVTVLPLSTRDTVHLATVDGFHSMPVTAVKSVDIVRPTRRSTRKRSN